MGYIESVSALGQSAYNGQIEVMIAMQCNQDYLCLWPLTPFANEQHTDTHGLDAQMFWLHLAVRRAMVVSGKRRTLSAQALDRTSINGTDCTRGRNGKRAIKFLFLLGYIWHSFPVKFCVVCVVCILYTHTHTLCCELGLFASAYVCVCVWPMPACLCTRRLSFSDSLGPT